MAPRKKSPGKTEAKRNGPRHPATSLLKDQHRKVEDLFEQLESGDSDHEEIVSELANNLAAHMKIEQDIFYPRVRALDEDLVLESFEEHALAEVALKRLLATSSDEPTFDARSSILEELIRHHVEEEEHSLFPKVDKKLSAEEGEALSKEMKAVFDDALAQGHEAILPQGGETSSDIAEHRVLESGGEARH